jgi:hypothetical protein
MICQRPLALTAIIAFTVVAAGFGLATPQRAEAAAPPTVDPVIEWNRTLLQLIRTPGSDASPPQLTPGTTPGSYRPTPPNFVPPVFTHWPKVRPFALTRASQFRPGKPPALTSATYIAALQEVQRLGDVHSTTRTADQTQIANFWAAHPELLE